MPCTEEVTDVMLGVLVSRSVALERQNDFAMYPGFFAHAAFVVSSDRLPILRRFNRSARLHG
jgi:hypothetical protein